MKKVLLLQARVSEDAKTKERIVFVTFANLPTRSSQGKIWYPKKEELFSISCFGEDRHPALFGLLRKAVPGTLCGVSYGVNDFNGKTFISDVKVLKENYTEADIYDRLDDDGNTVSASTEKQQKKTATATTTDGDIPY